MGWKDKDPNKDTEYSQVINDGFIYTEGSAQSLNFGDKEKHDLGGRVSIPVINFLKVNPKSPMEVRELDSFTVRAVGDTRLPATIWEDHELYNQAGLVIVPYEVDKENLKGWKNVEIFKEGFERADGSKTPLSILYIDKGLGVDMMGIHTWSAITPPQMIRRIFDWLYLKKEFSYSKGKNWGEENPWTFAGRVNMNHGDLVKFVQETALMLEERFEERLFPRRPMDF